MNATKILQESIINISPPIFLSRLVLFNLISDKEREALQNSLEWEQQQKSNKDVSTITTFIIKKLNDETAVYHERFKIFLGYYTDLKFIYRNWKIIGKKTLTVNLNLHLLVLQHVLLDIFGCELQLSIYSFQSIEDMSNFQLTSKTYTYNHESTAIFCLLTVK